MKKAIQQVKKKLHLDTKIPSISDFHCTLLTILRQQYPLIDPRWYDIDQQSIIQYFPNLGPLIPPTHIIEEPPFVLISPWKPASITDLQTKPLVIKTPSNAYRIGFFRDFFAAQKMKVLHLKRQAEHAINGLMDGWMYSRGFHAHWIDSAEIRHPDIPKQLWKYDLPPDWQHFQRAPLHQVCAFQWLQAHRYILADQTPLDDYHSIWFSALLNHDSHQIAALWNWLNVDPQPIQPISALPLVMATCAPRARRWFSKKEIITQRCTQRDIQECMEQLREERK